MTISRKALCVVYALVAVLALVGTWGNVLGMVSELGFWDGTLRFWQDTLVNGSSRFITVDVLFFALAVIVWMLLEARRLAIPGVWLYIVIGLLIAISVAFPVFMIHRERKLAAIEPGEAAGSLGSIDGLAISILGLGVVAYAIVALSM